MQGCLLSEEISLERDTYCPSPLSITRKTNKSFPNFIH